MTRNRNSKTRVRYYAIVIDQVGDVIHMLSSKSIKRTTGPLMKRLHKRFPDRRVVFGVINLCCLCSGSMPHVHDDELDMEKFQ